jgi:hypothetical protein
MLMYDFPQNNIQGLREQREVTRRRYKKILWQDKKYSRQKTENESCENGLRENIYFIKGTQRENTL